MLANVTTNKSVMLTQSAAANEYRERGISERAIRRWVREGAFPVVRVGVKVLINQDLFEMFLRGEMRQ
jgi:excisionase family DNA binding protein